LTAPISATGIVAAGGAGARERAKPLDPAANIGNGIAVRIAVGGSQQRIDAANKAIGAGVLEAISVLVHLVPGIVQGLYQEGF